MGTYTRSHSFTAGEKPTEAQWNVDIDGLITLCNGQIDKANVDSSSTDGIVTMDEAQTISGAKTFSSDILTSGSGIVVGASSQVVISDGGGATNATPEVQVLGTGFDDSAALLACFSTTATRAAAPTLALMKSGHGTLGSNTVVTDNEILGSIIAYGADGTDFESPAAAIEFAVDGTPGTGDMPGEIKMYTTADSGETLTLALTLSAAQAATFAGPVTVGSDGSGKDVVFYSGTSGDNLTWDASEEVLQITGTDGQTSLDVLDGDVRVVDKLYLYDRGGEYLSSDGSTLTITGAVSTSSTFATTGAATLASLVCTAGATFGGGTGDSGATISTTGTGTFDGILKTEDTTDATSTTDGSLQTDGGLSVAKDAIIGNDLKLLSDSAVLALGAGDDATLTHDGTTGVTIAANPIIVDSGGNLTLDAHTGILIIKDAGSEVLRFTEGNSGDVTVKLETNGKDLIFTDNGDATNMKILDAAAGINVPGEVQTTGIGYTDGDNAITIADGGGCTFPQTITATGDISVGDDILVATGGVINFASGDVTVTHAANTLSFAGATSGYQFDSEIVFINETANTQMTTGLTINQGSSDDSIFAGKSTDVNHPMTAEFEADTFFAFQKYEAGGGLNIRAYKDGTGAPEAALTLDGNLGEAAESTETTASDSVTMIRGFITNGSTGTTDVADGGNVFNVANRSTTHFLVKGNGDLYGSDTSITAFDDAEDVMVLRSAELSLRTDGLIPTSWDEEVRDRYHYDRLVDMGLIGYVSPDELAEGVRPLVNLSMDRRLTRGALWQGYIRDMELQKACEYQQEQIESWKDYQQEQIDSLKAELLLLKG